MVKKYLLKTTETYRVESYPEVEMFENELRNDDNFTLIDFGYTEKFDKKTEQEYFVVRVKKVFNAEKEISNRVAITYEIPEFKLEV